MDEAHGSSSHTTKNKPVTKEDTAAGKGANTPEVMPDCLNKGDREEDDEMLPNIGINTAMETLKSGM